MRSAQSTHQFKVRWRPFLLRPNMPEDGKEKAPDTPDNPRVGARLKAAGKTVGIDFTGKTDRYPNSVLAHTLLAFALQNKGEDVQNQLSEVLFRHYFTDGLYPNVSNLVLAAQEVGFDEQQARVSLNDAALQTQVKREAQEYSSGGVSGVPYFFINGNRAFSGAQDPSTFLGAFEQFK